MSLSLLTKKHSFKITCVVSFIYLKWLKHLSVCPKKHPLNTPCSHDLFVNIDLTLHNIPKRTHTFYI